MVSRYYVKYVRELLKSRGDPRYLENCVEIIKEALNLSTHLVRARSVARAAGFCALYGRMAEKMGVYEVLESNSAARGREIHRLLGLASFNLFLENPAPKREQAENLAKKYVETAAEELKDLYEMNEESIVVAEKLLRRLIYAIPRAKQLLGLSHDDPLFPVVEQMFADYGTRIYGTPDLVLENAEKRKAIVVEWKTYKLEEGYQHPADFEKAQVIAYSIIEAKRLGVTKLRRIFECISGIRYGDAEKLLDSRNLGHFSVDEHSVSKLLRVLPIIVTPSGSYPPHPLMYSDPDSFKKARERFVKFYKLFIGVVVAAEHLALQVINIPKLLSVAAGNDLGDLAARYCSTKDGYQAYGYTPFKYLRGGKPGRWEIHPCRMCSFRGDDGPCAFYFGSGKSKDYFDKLMWWARYKVYWERERDLLNHRAMHELFREPGVVHRLLHSKDPLEIEVDLSKLSQLRVNVREGSIVYLVRIKRGHSLQGAGKFKLDLFKISDAEFDKDNNVIELRRDLRDVERQSNVVGFIKKSIQVAIIEPGRTISPLLSINTFAMIDESFVDESGRVVYRCYSPSPALQCSFAIFGKYLELYKRRNPEAMILAYEAPVDLTIMELRAIDALHRYIKFVSKSPNLNRVLEELREKYNVSEVGIEDLVKEAELLKEFIPRDSKTMVASHLHAILSKRIIVGGNDGEDNPR